MPEIKKIIITGTHLTPALELINQLKEDSINWDITYIGRKYNSSVDSIPSIESQTIPNLNIKFYGFQSGKYDRRWLPNTISGIPQTIKSFLQINKLVKKIKPDITVSFGGYISTPVIISSFLNKISSITHEQTNTLSLATKINSFFVNKIATSFNSKIKNSKYVITGNLLRREIFDARSKHFESLNIKKPIIYITGGNQGSAIINQVVDQILPELSKNYFIIHQTGQQSHIQNQNSLQLNYIDINDIGWVLNHAKIIISRSGANTCQEIMALSKNSILIPLKISQQNEQMINAKIVKKHLPNQTIIIPEISFNSQILFDSINKLSKVKTNNISNTININYNLLNLIKSF